MGVFQQPRPAVTPSAFFLPRAAYGSLHGLMQVEFAWPPPGIAANLPLGLAGTWKALGHQPGGYLREE